MAVDFARVKGLLFDMDGVWYVGDTVIPGAADTLAHIRRARIPCRFITNTTTMSLDDLADKMNRLGLPVKTGEIINAPRAAAMFLAAKGNPSCHLIVDDNVRAEFDRFPDSDTPDYVVIGDIGGRWSYDLLNEAFRKLIGGAELIAMHKGRYWQVEDGLALDIGAFVAGLEYATGKTATLVGKPSPTVFRSALSDLGIEAANAAMIGDDIHTDIGGAKAVGLTGILVKTGKYREELIRNSGVTPDAVIDSVTELRRLIPRD